MSTVVTPPSAAPRTYEIRTHGCRSEEHTSELQSHRDLHSFPTRRSSDLFSRPVSAALPLVCHVDRRDPTERRPPDVRDPHPRLPDERARLRAAGRAVG